MNRETIDLSIGEPSFLKPFWAIRSMFKISILPDEVMSYQYGGLPQLKEKIVALHKHIGNARTDGHHVVIGAGASQCLMAAMWAIREMRGETNFHYKAPYWYRFPEMISILGEGPEHYRPFNAYIVTSPNNPDGAVTKQVNKPNTILDCCYNWPHYTAPRTYDAPIVIFSLAKVTGHAGSRIGWAVVRDQHVAELMQRYIEKTTSGVSVDSQLRAITILDAVMTPMQFSASASMFEYGRRELDLRWNILGHTLEEHRVGFSILNKERCGLFAWCRVEPGIDAAEFFMSKFGIKVMPGEKCGGHRNQCRLNMGGNATEFVEAIERMKDAATDRS